MTSTKHRFNKSDFAKLGETPRKDWRLALLSLAGGLIVVIAIDGLLFLSLSREQKAVTPGGSIVTLERTELGEAVKTTRKADVEAGVVPASVRKDPAARPAQQI